MTTETEITADTGPAISQSKAIAILIIILISAYLISRHQQRHQQLQQQQQCHEWNERTVNTWIWDGYGCVMDETSNGD